jgi:hypothetical protein
MIVLNPGPSFLGSLLIGQDTASIHRDCYPKRLDFAETQAQTTGRFLPRLVSCFEEIALTLGFRELECTFLVPVSKKISLLRKAVLRFPSLELYLVIMMPLRL